ncbi:MAG: helix-turn-helix transcriptional regulator [Acidobacteria bacterium]|nr:helix-turn-helix transcriptional regulator [Acidobacteriota bacterium]MBV9475088.1 helix-turn-helix transcriptional regulator [Acidobacteriota bacterium]
MAARSPAVQLVGARLRELRKSRGLSQEQLGHLCGLDRNYVGQIERGNRNPCLDNIVKLAKALGVTPADLFSRFDLDTMRDV